MWRPPSRSSAFRRAMHESLSTPSQPEKFGSARKWVGLRTTSKPYSTAVRAIAPMTSFAASARKWSGPKVPFSHRLPQGAFRSWPRNFRKDASSATWVSSTNSMRLCLRSSRSCRCLSSRDACRTTRFAGKRSMPTRPPSFLCASPTLMNCAMGGAKPAPEGNSKIFADIGPSQSDAYLLRKSNLRNR